MAAVAMTARLVLGALDPAIGEQMLKDLRDAKLVPDSNYHRPIYEMKR